VAIYVGQTFSFQYRFIQYEIALLNGPLDFFLDKQNFLALTAALMMAVIEVVAN